MKSIYVMLILLTVGHCDESISLSYQVSETMNSGEKNSALIWKDLGENKVLSDNFIPLKGGTDGVGLFLVPSFGEKDKTFKIKEINKLFKKENNSLYWDTQKMKDRIITGDFIASTEGINGIGLIVVPSLGKKDKIIKKKEINKLNNAGQTVQGTFVGITKDDPLPPKTIITLEGLTFDLPEFKHKNVKDKNLTDIMRSISNTIKE